MTLQNWWDTADGVGIAVFLALAVMSLVSWYVGLTRISRRLRARRIHGRFLDRFHEASDVAAMADLASAQPPHQPYARLARQLFLALDGHRRPGHREIDAEPVQDFLDRVMGHALDREQAGLERGMVVLSTVASTAPFVGLFGTVWGIHHALAAIAHSAQAGLSELAGPVGEALVMTGFGLFVAVPAVLFHNWLARDNRLLILGLTGFIQSLFTRLSTGHRHAGFASAPARLRDARPAALAS